MAVNDRVLIPQGNGLEDKVEFKFVKWERLIEIKIVKKRLHFVVILLILYYNYNIII